MGIQLRAAPRRGHCRSDAAVFGLCEAVWSDVALSRRRPEMGHPRGFWTRNACLWIGNPRSPSKGGLDDGASW